MDVTVTRNSGRRMEIEARGLRIVVDRLVEDGGPGDGFRPTELLLGSLAACMIGTMLTFAERQDIGVETVTVRAADDVARAPERIERIRIEMRVEGGIDPEKIATLERVAARCKIHNTLERSPEIDFELSPA